MADKPLSEYVGRNERTKVVAKLAKKGAGPPAREPVVDADTQKAMMAWYYKKQEEQKVRTPCNAVTAKHASGKSQQPTSLKGTH